MQLDRTKNTKRNIFFGFLNKLIGIGLPFLVRTAIIQILGAQYLGLNSLFTSILQVLSLTELGFSNAVVQSMYKPIAENDTNTICALLKYYRFIYRVIGVIIAVIGLGIMPFLPFLIKNGEHPDDINIYVLYLIYLSNTVISYLLFAYKKSILNALQRTDIISNLNSVIQMIFCVLQLLVLVLFHNYYWYLFLLPVATIVENLWTAWYVHRKYPQYDICKGDLSKECKDELKTKVKGLMLYKLCGTTRNTFDSIFISAFLGLTVTAMYSNYFYVVTSLIGIAGVITSSMLAGIGNSMELCTKEKNYEDMKRIDYIYMLFSGWMAICMFCLYQPFMKLWAGEELMFSASVAFLFSLYFYELKMGDIRATYSDAAGLWWENRYRTVIEAVVNIIFNYVLVQIWGVYGVIIATLISLFLFGYMASAFVLFRCYFTEVSVWDYFKNHILYFGVTFFVGAITYWLCSRIRGGSWMILIGRGIICCIVPVILYGLIYYKTKRFQDAMKWMKGIIIR